MRGTHLFTLPNLGVPSYGDEYQAVYDSFTTKPIAATAEIWNTMVESLVSSGEWSMLDIFDVFAAHINSGSEALKNWISPGTFNPLLIGAPVFTANEGFMGTGVIDLVWNPFADGVNYIQDSGTLGAYSRTDVNENSAIVGGNDVTDGARILPRRTGTARITVNALTATDDRAVVADSLGMLIATRTANNVQKLYKNKVAVINGVDASSGVPNINLYALANNNNGSQNQERNGQISLAFAGAGMTQTNINNITNAFNTAMTALGKNV